MPATKQQIAEVQRVVVEPHLNAKELKAEIDRAYSRGRKAYFDRSENPYDSDDVHCHAAWEQGLEEERQVPSSDE